MTTDKTRSSIESYSKLEVVASFFMEEAFKYAHAAAEYEVAGIIYGRLIRKIDIDPEWTLPTLPESLPELLNLESELEIIPEEVVSQLAAAWSMAQRLAATSQERLPKKHLFESVSIVGHIINLSACVESVINRHLFLLRESGKLEDSLYSSLDRTEVMPKLLFAFKDEILSGKLKVSRIKRLFRLRNFAVHYKASTANSITVSCEELLGLWNDVGHLLACFVGEPSQQTIQELSTSVAKRWLDT